jgi:hypothetical protein
VIGPLASDAATKSSAEHGASLAAAKVTDHFPRADLLASMYQAVRNSNALIREWNAMLLSS